MTYFDCFIHAEFLLRNAKPASNSPCPALALIPQPYPAFALANRAPQLFQSYWRIHRATVTLQRKTKQPPAPQQFRKNVPRQIARHARWYGIQKFGLADAN